MVTIILSSQKGLWCGNKYFNHRYIWKQHRVTWLRQYGACMQISKWCLYCSCAPAHEQYYHHCESRAEDFSYQWADGVTSYKGKERLWHQSILACRSCTFDNTDGAKISSGQHCRTAKLHRFQLKTKKRDMDIQLSAFSVIFNRDLFRALLANSQVFKEGPICPRYGGNSAQVPDIHVRVISKGALNTFE